jgi:predicted small metal-binding protein
VAAVEQCGGWRGKKMTKLIKCECGFMARGDTDDAVVEVIEDHMRADHPDVLASVDRRDIYGWIEQV